METKQKNKAIKEIKRLWNKAEYCINNKAISRYATELLKMCRDETQDHDRNCGTYTKGGA